MMTFIDLPTGGDGADCTHTASSSSHAEELAQRKSAKLNVQKKQGASVGPAM